ncbi:MAG: glutamyl-tRNA reductase [Tagaea sp. CACIAM 22H2]|nr:glutamyl-tRNA reductase [Tagaea sp. CACIAM 22H2]
MSAPSTRPRLCVVGANHKTASSSLRDALFVPEAEMRGLLETLKRAGLRQAVAMSTCDRTELQIAADDPDAARDAVLAALAPRSGLSADELRESFYVASGDDALRHVFAVAASLDSQVVGEPQVLGQLKAAHRLSREMGLTGPELDAALEHAYAAAKRVRSETAIGERPVSLAAAAAEVARDVHGNVASCTGLLIGAGEMGETLVEHFQRAGMKKLNVAAPSAARAGDLARRLNGTAVSFDALDDALAAADLVFSALGRGQETLDAPRVEAALKRRRRRPILLLDLAVPEEIARAVEKLDGAFRYAIDDLEGLALKGRAEREASLAEAWKIVDGELDAFRRQGAARAADPAIVALRRRFESERQRVLAETQDAARATELLIHRLLHAPSEELRALTQGDPKTREMAEQLVARLFRTDES